MSHLDSVDPRSDWQHNYQQYQHPARPLSTHLREVVKLRDEAPFPLSDSAGSVTAVPRTEGEHCDDGKAVDFGDESVSGALSTDHYVGSEDRSAMQIGPTLPLSSHELPPQDSSKMTLPDGFHVGGGNDSSLDELEPGIKDEEEELDDDMDDVDGQTGDTQPDTFRKQDRKKMKRFRLTHQQTRFLQQEFGRQAHPDAAHRERLSKEIPGLSPRQVQVWFQNRRAKIKRVHVDHRDQVVKSRSVPDGFDSVGALHATYGALDVSGTNLMTPVEYQHSYADSQMRPLMVDTIRRNEMDHISPGGMSHSTSNNGFANASIPTPDLLSPLSVNSSDRFYSYGQASPIGGPRSSNPFLRQNSLDTYSNLGRDSSRSLQPLQLRDTLSRSRSESLQSPLRSSMSWKGNSLDHGTYGDNISPTSRHQLYNPEQSQDSQGYGNNGYTIGYSLPTSYPAAQPNLTSVPTLPRYRTSSSTFPPALELRSQYRGFHSQQNTNTPSTPNHPSTPRTASFGPPYSLTTTGFASAPLNAPTDFGLPRTPASLEQCQMSQTQDTRVRDFNFGQMSAPMAPPQDFTHQSRPTQASSPGRSNLNNDLGPERRGHPEYSTVTNVNSQAQQTGANDARFSGERYDASQEEQALKRKRTYSMDNYQPA